MAALTFFLATSPSKKTLSLNEMETLLLALLHDRHISLPAAIFVGAARNEARGEELETARKEGTYPQAGHSIIPNGPGSMLSVVEALTEGQEMALETLWYYGDNEAAFVEALRRLPLRERDVCFCFPSLDHELSEATRWADEGAVLYALTRPFPIDFMDTFSADAAPVIDYPVSDYFTLSSFSGGGFPHSADHPLKPLLQQCFGPDLEMKQTRDRW
ncbi:MAG: hypothetical protein ABI456_04450 [Ktedonobacteraceae bacterium]|nr:hypothetical protein [Chloroflexota bacterium]